MDQWIIVTEPTEFDHVLKCGETMTNSVGNVTEDEHQHQQTPARQDATKSLALFVLGPANVKGQGQHQSVRPRNNQILLPPTGGHDGQVEAE